LITFNLENLSESAAKPTTTTLTALTIIVAMTIIVKAMVSTVVTMHMMSKKRKEMVE
jgi:hypothetical protein